MRSSSSSRQPKAPQVYQRLGFTEKKILQMAQLTTIMSHCGPNAQSTIDALKNLELKGGIPLGLDTAQFTTIMAQCGPHAQKIIDALNTKNPGDLPQRNKRKVIEAINGGNATVNHPDTSKRWVDRLGLDPKKQKSDQKTYSTDKDINDLMLENLAVTPPPPLSPSQHKRMAVPF